MSGDFIQEADTETELGGKKVFLQWVTPLKDKRGKKRLKQKEPLEGDADLTSMKGKVGGGRIERDTQTIRQLR